MKKQKGDHFDIQFMEGYWYHS